MNIFQAFIAVIKELWEFVFPGRTRLLLPPPQSDTSTAAQPNCAPPISSLLTTRAIVIEETGLLTRPVLSFDGCMRVLRFPDEVAVVGTEGDFSCVRNNEIVGWVATKYLELNPSSIEPHFISGVTYTAADPETIKLRRLINDSCLGGVLHVSLQSIEFVLWRLSTNGHIPPFGFNRPRLPGTWQQLLKGQSGVHIGVEPKTGSVVEYIKENGEGCIGFVSAVHPNLSLLVQSVGFDTEGEYHEAEVSVATWREWRPVFISFT